ncbi:hypothetical protein UT300012_22210 [Paraclostridium bifermentans]
MENKLQLFNDHRDLNIQKNRGEFLYNSLLKGEYSLDDLGQVDRYCVLAHAKYLKEKRLEEQEKVIKSICSRPEYEPIIRGVASLDIEHFDIRNWKLLLNTVSFIDFMEYNKDIIGTVQDLDRSRRFALEDLQKKFIKTRDKDSKDLAVAKKEYTETLDRFTKTASKTEQIIRMGYQYSVMLKEKSYDDMVKIYKSLNNEEGMILSKLAEEFGSLK